MVNYKVQSHKRIIIDTLEITVPSNAKIVVLHEPTAASASADAMRDDADGAAYVVTSGKTFTCLGVLTDGDGNAGNVVISSGDTEDAETATVMTVYNWTSLNEQWHILPFTIASAKFITINPSSTQIKYMKMLGYEL